MTSYAALASATFSHADLPGVDLELADLRTAKLVDVVTRDASFERADLRHADLSHSLFFQMTAAEANVRSGFVWGTRFQEVNLRAANFADAVLHESVFNCAYLGEACFQQADLVGAVFREAELDLTSFKGATIGGTVFGHIDLSSATGLEDVVHQSRSTVGIDALRETASGLAVRPHAQGPVEYAFFQGRGLDEGAIAYFRSLIGRPIEFFTCALSRTRMPIVRSHEDCTTICARYSPLARRTSAPRWRQYLRPRVDRAIRSSGQSNPVLLKRRP